MASLTLLFGSLYCAAYCRIAFDPMHHGTMPLWQSVWWAVTALLPWLLAFETVKRVVPRASSRRSKLVAFAAIAAGTAILTLIARAIDMSGLPDHWRMLAASQLQPVLLFLILTGLWTAERNETGEAGARRMSDDDLPPLHLIDWIRAAGNYVELQCGGRLLIRRMTMRAVERKTAGNAFIRVHRSVIVREDLIVGFAAGDRSRLLLRTGDTLPVGDSYRRGVERLVTSSPTLGTSAHLPS